MSYSLKPPLFLLAPMDDVTDTIFRQIIFGCSPPDISFSEFVNVDGLISAGRQRLIKKLFKSNYEAPLIAQLWGLDPDNFYMVSKQIVSGNIAKELGIENCYSGIDLNMGCPAKDVVKTGACSALINNRKLAENIINATKRGSAGLLPISVKTRIGYDRIDISWIEFLLNQGLDMLTVHLRTTKEMSRVEPHYDLLSDIVELRNKIAKQTLIIANGDIANRIYGQEIINQFNVDGVMIGRGVFQDPFAFSEVDQWSQTSPQERINLFVKHLTAYKLWADNPNTGVKRLNKYAKIYLNGFYAAKGLRESLAKLNTIDEMIATIDSFVLSS